VIQWKEGVSAADKKRVLDGVKEMAAKIPGMKNVWTKALRVQPEGYHDAFAIEFENQAAADRYAKDPVHDAWTAAFIKIREASVSPQITNEGRDPVRGGVGGPDAGHPSRLHARLDPK